MTQPRLSHAALAGLLMGLLSLSVNAAPPAATFKAGFAERDITPDIGMEQPGNYMKQFHRVIHDPCKVRAAVFDDGTTRVALVGLDTLKIRRPSVEAARKGIAERCGIDPANVMIAASHTHSGGPTGMVLPGEYDGADDLVKSLAYEKSSCANPAFLAKLEKAIVDAVTEANEKRVAVKAAAGYGHEDKVAFPRRLRMKNGTTASHPGAGNPEIVEPAGPTDPTVGVMGAWDDKGKLVGCVVNFACHATTGPGGASADYICYVEKVLRGFFGPETTVVFLNGACGDVTQVDNQRKYDIKQSGEAMAEFVGGRVGAEALKTLLSIRPSAGALSPVTAKTRTLDIPRRVPSAARVEKCLDIVKQGQPKGGDATNWIFAKEIVMLDYIVKQHPVVPVEVQAIQVGPAVFLSNPAEYFCQFGLDIRAGSKFPFTFPVELANDCVGYVPTEEAMSPTGGGYETRLTAYSNLEPKAGTRIRDALIELSGTLTPGAVPEPPALPPFKGDGWRYGNVPPELE